MLKIVTIPDAVLTQGTKPVGAIDSKIKKLVKDMEEALLKQRDPEGVGLAAPQVGIGLSLFIVKHSGESPTLTCINPKIIAVFEPPLRPITSRNKMEGCLSIPRIWAPLARHKRVQLQYTDLNGLVRTQTYTGLMSIVVQHEMDHLNGILFTRRCLENNVPLYEEKGDGLEPMKSL